MSPVDHSDPHYLSVCEEGGGFQGLSQQCKVIKDTFLRPVSYHVTENVTYILWNAPHKS